MSYPKRMFQIIKKKFVNKTLLFIPYLLNQDLNFINRL